jgi:hypothetical protein
VPHVPTRGPSEEWRQELRGLPPLD